jgi:hypothetical protein
MPLRSLASFTLLWLCIAGPLSAQHHTWRFAVSGDSRNCGDVVMPAIAKGALTDGAAFYWHLGDFRAIYTFDEDYQQLHKPLTISGYLSGAWQDFIDNQLRPFGNLPVYLAFGNHELIPPKTREPLVAQFADWLNSDAVRKQRLRDNPHDYTVRGYYHWRQDGIDFITLDNASPDQFDAPQLAWLQGVLAADRNDKDIRAIVVGMHEALPYSISADHSMNQSPDGVESGTQVYSWLLEFSRQTKKAVYVLASHSHFYMDGIFNTDYWRSHGGVLPGWIVGTAGAVRYPLPPHANDAKEAKAHVYGYLMGTVSDSDTDPIRLVFHELKESDVPQDVKDRFTPAFVHECWTANPPQ